MNKVVFSLLNQLIKPKSRPEAPLQKVAWKRPKSSASALPFKDSPKH